MSKIDKKARIDLIFGEEIYELTDEDPWEFAAGQGINILSHLDMHCVYVNNDGGLVAVLFSGVSGDDYEFDIVVHPDYRNLGIASELMDIAIDNYEDLLEPFPHLAFRLDVVNPIAKKMLEKRGFRVIGGNQDRPIMTKNPLDPFAWLREEHRFDMPGESADIRLGVHATTNFNAALAYAVHKASQESELPSGEPNCGIILVLDVDGLEPIPEADSIIASKHQSVVIKEMISDRGIRRQIDSVDGLSEAIHDFVEMQRDFYEPSERIVQDDWFEAFWREHVFDLSPWIILNPLERLAENDKEKLFCVIREAVVSEKFPLEMWAEAIEQWRFMSPIGFDRLIRVYAVHPVEPDLVDDLYFEDEEDGPIAFDAMEVDGPEIKLLWDAGIGIPVNAMYHGTDVSRARKAFSEISNMINSPWSFGQPEGVGP